ncbi:MAG: DUF6199 family natural product biosynthesis protein [Bulleidia sp.]
MQEIIAGIVMGIIGLVLYFAPVRIWNLTEGWKYKGETEPSETVLKIIRTVGVVMIAAGIIVGTGLLK